MRDEKRKKAGPGRMALAASWLLVAGLATGAYFGWLWYQTPARLTVVEPASVAAMDPELAESVRIAIDRCNESQDPEQVLQLGRLYHANQVLDEADATYTLYLERVPDSLEGWYLKGLCATSLGNVEEAIRCFQTARKKEPRDADACWRLALAVAENGETERALELVDEAISLRPSNLQIWLVRAKILLDADRPDECLKILDSLDFTPTLNRDYALFLRQDCQRRQGLPVEAAPGEQEFRIKPLWLDAHASSLMDLEKGLSAARTRAYFYFERRNWLEAGRILGQIVRHPAAKWEDRNQLANCLIQLGKHAEAIAILQNEVRVHPDAYELQMTLAQALIGQYGDSNPQALDQSALALDAAIAADASRWEAYEGKAQLAQLQKKNDEALKWYDEACARIAKPGLCHVRRVYLLLELGQWDQVLERVNELEPEYREDPFMILALGRMYVGQQKWDEARAALARAREKAAGASFWQDGIDELAAMLPPEPESGDPK